ncbi:hypothetical protein [Psychrobacter lutiphocae]|uniref:hypothetical protein n=1 Tax=Psychrobacter lutiphocae TaxID=540500 RepID=UPI00035D25A3|nr:hypothetical protein [Psychrobacter lutiphocae]
MIPDKSSKLLLWSTIFATLMGLTACQKETPKESESVEEPEVMMSAEPAEDNTPIIVADDLDEVDAESQLAEEARAETEGAALEMGLEPKEVSDKAQPEATVKKPAPEPAAPEVPVEAQPKSDQ